MTSASTDVLLVRHAQTAWNVRKLCQGHTDVPLDDAGYAMAEVLADSLASERIDALYCSDLRRALETAEPIAARHGLPLIRDVRLRECRLVPSHPTDEYPVLPYHVDLETEACVLERLTVCMREIAERHEGQRVLVMSHGGVIRRFLQHVFGTLPSPGAGRSSNAVIHHIRYECGLWLPVRLHVRDHLDRAGLAITPHDAE